MQPPVVAVVVWKNGTKSQKESLCLEMKYLISVLFLNIGYVRNSILIEEKFSALRIKVIKLSKLRFCQIFLSATTT
jgi:hypothetical protein